MQQSKVSHLSGSQEERLDYTNRNTASLTKGNRMGQIKERLLDFWNPKVRMIGLYGCKHVLSF